MIIEVASNSNPIVCSTPSSIKYGLFDIAGGGVLEAVHFSISIATLGAVVSDNDGGAFITNELSEEIIQFNFSNVKYRGAIFF